MKATYICMLVSSSTCNSDAKLMRCSPDLNDGVDVYEVQPLDLVRFQPMGTLHSRQYSHDLLRKSSEKKNTGKEGARGRQRQTLALTVIS